MPSTTTRETAGIITVAKLRAAKPGQWLTEKWPKGEGTFQIRKLAKDKCVFYYRYTDAGGVQQRIALPRYNTEGQPISLAEARADAKGLARRYMEGKRDLKQLIEYERQQREREFAAAAAHERAAQLTRENTLGRLLMAYCDHLEAQGKVSAKATRDALRRHVEAPFPALWRTPASEISPVDLTPILQRLVKANKLRTANKVRSYLRAAYAAACSAPLNARAAASLRDLKITTNPARDLGVVQGANQVREYALSLEELRAFWRRLETAEGAGAAIMRLYLLTGGQRFEQLSRCTTEDISEGCLVMLDAKGRRSQPRRHLVPLLPEALQAMQDIAPNRMGPYLISLSAGERPSNNRSVMKSISKITSAMLAAGELKKPVSFGVLRRTVETRLAAAGVSSDVRAQLQSHGLGGIQSRHYDRHGYLEEKQEALERLRGLMR